MSFCGTKQNDVQSSITQRLSQARINWEGCSKKGIRHKTGGDDEGGGTGNPNELTCSWIISMDDSVSLTHCEQNQKCSSITTILGRRHHHSGPPCVVWRGGSAALQPSRSKTPGSRRRHGFGTHVACQLILAVHLCRHSEQQHMLLGKQAHQLYPWSCSVGWCLAKVYKNGDHFYHVSVWLGRTSFSLPNYCLPAI